MLAQPRLGRVAQQPRRGAGALRRGGSRPLLLCGALAALACGGAHLLGRPGRVVGPARPPAAERSSVLAAPAGLREPLSARIGAADPLYRVRPGPGTAFAANPAQRLAIRFARSSVGIAAGDTRVQLRLAAIGYGNALGRPGPPVRRVFANRVVYSRAGVREWYANGPLGLEQGFELLHPPAGRRSGPLTLALSLAGGAPAMLSHGARSAGFRGPGGPLVRYGELSASDARGRPLPASMATVGDRLLLRVRAGDARYPLRIDPLVQQGSKVRAQEAAGAVGFGVAVALSEDGETALIGAPGEDGGKGAAWVFHRMGSAWYEQGPPLVPADESGDGAFGGAVALSADGGTALIGGHADGGYVGAAWVFTRAGATWSQQGSKLLAGDEVGPGDFGASVAISADGDTALIGGWNDAGEYGAAWVFARSGSSWSQQGPKLVGSGVQGLPLIGRSVALSADGNTAVVGAPWDNDEGSVRVFTRAGSTWTQQGPRIQGSGEVGKANFGESVALSADGQTLLVGGPWDLLQPGSSDPRGAAWVFTRSGSTWSPGPKLTAGDERGRGFFGESVALSADGTTALIGGPADAGYSGSAWLFARSGSSWSESARLRGAGETEHAEYGGAVALSGDAANALIGGRGDDAFAGAAWFLAAAPAAQDAAQFGRCVKLRLRGLPPVGEYAGRSCTAPAEAGSWVWLPGEARPRFASSLLHGRVTLQTVGGRRVSCSAESGGGEYSGSGVTTEGGVWFSFAGCESSGESCESAGEQAGEIATAQLAGELGLIEAGPTRVQDRIGLRLSAAAGESDPVMRFACGWTQVSVRGSLIVALPSGRMRSRIVLRFRASQGRQSPTAFAEGPAETLEAAFGGEAYEAAGLAMRVSQIGEEPVEVDPAF